METEKTPVKEKLKGFWEKFKAALGKVSKVVWIIVAILIVALVAGIIIYANTRPYSILITGANPDEVTTVTTWLDSRGVRDYRTRGSGTVLVPERQAVALKAALLGEMYAPDSKYDYSGYFDNVSMLSTESERTNAWWIAVMEKMGAVISQMEGVQSATVEITPGEDRSYVLDASNVVNATASVMVRTWDGKVLDSNVAQAIRGYVSHGVQGLSIDNVVLYDTFGNPYNSIGEMDPSADFNASLYKLQLEQEYANKLRTEAMQVLIPLFGEDNVSCGVTVTVELNTTEVTEDGVYIPEYIDEEHRGAGQGIIGKRAGDYTYKASDKTIAGGLVGTEPNSDVPTNVEQDPAPDEVEGRLEGGWQTDYDNPRRTSRTYNTAGYVTDAHVAVSVNSTTAQELNIENLRNTVANATGISAIETDTQTAAEYLASKVSIYAGPFYQPPAVVPEPYPWWPFNDVIPGWIVLLSAAGLLLLIILIVIIVLAAKRHKKKKMAALAQAAEEEAAQAEQAALEEAEEERREAEAALAEAMGMPQTELVGADVMSLQTEKSMELRQDIRQFVEENPEVAAQLLKTWLRGGDDHG